jgi:hypothetical protein
MLHRGNPDTALTINVGSAIVLDIENQELYINAASLGTKWLHLGSIS